MMRITAHKVSKKVFIFCKIYKIWNDSFIYDRNMSVLIKTYFSFSNNHEQACAICCQAFSAIHDENI